MTRDMLSGVLTGLDFRWKIVVAVTISAALSGGYYIHFLKSQPSFDGLMLRVLAQAAKVDSYAELVDTDVLVSNRRLLITGLYRIDLKNAAFGSDSTTTLVATEGLPKTPNGVFTLRNVSRGDDVYYRVATKSQDLAYILSGGTDWHHFVKGSIPSAVAELAVSGPILDDLALFRSGSEYISFVRKMGIEASTTRYLLRLSGASSPADGPLHDLMSRVGHEGHIDLWVNEGTATIDRIHFSGENYESTTTIINFVSPQDISAPLLAE